MDAPAAVTTTDEPVEAPARPAQQDVLAALDPAVRRRVSKALRRHKDAIAERWAARHAQQPTLAANVVSDLGSWDAYRPRYLDPLLFVLARAFALGRNDYLHVYASERGRFLSSEERARGAQAELATILAADVADVADVLSGEPELARAAVALLTAVHEPLLHFGEGEAMTLALVGDCVMTEMKTFLHPGAEEAGIPLQTQHFFFTAGPDGDLSTADVEAALDRRRFDMVVLSFLTFEGLPLFVSLLGEADKLSEEVAGQRVDVLVAMMDRYVTRLRSTTNATILLQGCSGLPLGHLRDMVPLLPPMTAGRKRVIDLFNERLRELAEGTENVVFVDEAAAVEALGPRKAGRRFFPRRITRKGVFHPSVLGSLLAERYLDIVKAYRTLAKTKVLLIDFDNTLWEGVMAEGPVVHDLRAQRTLKKLQEAGMLLVAVSKNDPESIRWDEMELGPDDFVLHKVNWNLKAQSVTETAHQLDLDPSSFVLIDDNPVERDLVSKALPTVAVMDPLDPTTWDHLELMLEFPNTRGTEEAARRTEMYREASARRQALSGELDYAGMMGSLDLQVEWRAATEDDLDRVHELVDRTNQYNTTTIRRTRPELAALLAAGDTDVFVGSLSDKFGSLGIVGVVITRREGERLVFDSVIMSCRAMGFGFETVLVRGPIDAAQGASVAVGRYVATDRNGPCAALFEQHGFTRGEDDEWTLDLSGGALPEMPAWLAVTRG